MNKNISNITAPSGEPAVIVMAKRPIPGKVKTRLTADYTPLQAAQVHAAMLECVLARLATNLPGRHYLALDGGTAPPDPSAEPTLAYELPDTLTVIDQGQGDLGDRITHVWKSINPGSAVFFGVDSPDVPADILASIWDRLAPADAAIGPVDDGGYWCLAAHRHPPPLLAGIDWGTPAVYHQTHQAADEAGLRLLDLAHWHDVDTPADLLGLQDRIQNSDEPALIRLRQRLGRMTQDTTR